MSRPEHIAPPQFFYNEEESLKYARNTRMNKIQREMAERSIELLNLPKTSTPLHILDLGCGTGISGEVIEEYGHHCTGLDISIEMLKISKENNSSVIQCDMGGYLPFRPAMFDGCISISAIQWLCQSDNKNHNPITRLRKLFESLFGCLKRGSRAIFQVYPEKVSDLEMITNAATHAGFTGGVVIDFPNSKKAKKYYIVLMCGKQEEIPVGKGNNFSEDEDDDNEFSEDENYNKNKFDFENDNDDENERKGKYGEQIGIKVDKKKYKETTKPKKAKYKSRDWILQKKEKQRGKGMNVRPDSKYTGRKRSGKKF